MINNNKDIKYCIFCGEQLLPILHNEKLLLKEYITDKKVNIFIIFICLSISILSLLLIIHNFDNEVVKNLFKYKKKVAFNKQDAIYKNEFKDKTLQISSNNVF